MGVSWSRSAKSMAKASTRRTSRRIDRSAAEDMFLLSLAVRGVARQLGQQASFMPKISPEVAGSGLHIHLEPSVSCRKTIERRTRRTLAG